jgi:hypothetical protein
LNPQTLCFTANNCKMPNWCSVVLRFCGEEAAVQSFLARWKNPECLSFQDFVPIPEEEEDNWYEWNCNNWGTKWDLPEDQTQVVKGNGYVDVETQTAWSPPIKFLEKVAKDFPDLCVSISYSEPAMMFAGYREWSEGVETENCHISYESLREFVQAFNDYPCNFSTAWWAPSESELEEEAENEKE